MTDRQTDSVLNATPLYRLMHLQCQGLCDRAGSNAGGRRSPRTRGRRRIETSERLRPALSLSHPAETAAFFTGFLSSAGFVPLAGFASSGVVSVASGILLVSGGTDLLLDHLIPFRPHPHK